MIIDFYRKVRRIFNILVGKDFYTTLDCKLTSKKFGSQYGGWNIVVDNINEDSIILSFGLGEDVSFDLDLISDFDVVIHGFDPTPKSIEWIKEQQLPQQFTLHEIGLSDFDGSIEFHPPENPDYVSHTLLNRTSVESSSITVPVKNITTIINELALGRVDIMKMDIEGAEYDVITDLKKSSVKPKQLLVEFHHRFPEVGVIKTKSAVHELRSMGYKLFFISTNGEEYSFIYDPSNQL